MSLSCILIIYCRAAYCTHRFCSCEDLAEVEAVVRAVVALDFALAALLVGPGKAL